MTHPFSGKIAGSLPFLSFICRKNRWPDISGDQMMLGAGLAIALASGTFAVSMTLKVPQVSVSSTGSAHVFGGLSWKQPINVAEIDQGDIVAAVRARSGNVDFAPLGSISAMAQPKNPVRPKSAEVSDVRDQHSETGALSGFSLVTVADGAAVVQARRGFVEVRVGTRLGKNNEVLAIEQRNGKWVVVTALGLISDVE